jgi:tRNA/rRNA methyltransferase/tRNA (cytidine32/uridine32-2'-O)-methyltransferase
MSDQYAVLARVKIVLVETSHPGNIGGVARAMKNMGLTDLALVNPHQFPSQEASARASGAGDILAGATVYSTLEEAVQDAEVVVGASARLRKVAWPQLDVRETADKLHQVARMAIVFGREDSGLTNAELDLCHYLAHIPSNPDYTSLNLAAAVQVFAYECRMACKPVVVESEGYKYPPATSEQMEGFYAHFQETLIDIEYLEAEKNARFMRRMRRLFNRALLDSKEVDILRGVCTAAQRQVKLKKELSGHV